MGPPGRRQVVDAVRIPEHIRRKIYPVETSKPRTMMVGVSYASRVEVFKSVNMSRQRITEQGSTIPVTWRAGLGTGGTPISDTIRYPVEVAH